MSKESVLRDTNVWQPSFALDTTKIEWCVAGNPKRPHGKAAARFNAYFGSLTVKDYIDNGGTKGDLRYDWQHRFLELIPAENAESENAESENVESAKVESAKAESGNAESAKAEVDSIFE